MTRKRTKLISWICAETVFLLMLFFGSVYDFQISRALCDVQNVGGVYSAHVGVWAKALEVIGEWPALVFCAFALIVIARNLKKKADDGRVLAVIYAAYIFAFITLLVGWLLSFKDILGAEILKKWWIILIIASLTLLLEYLLIDAVFKLDKNKLRAFFIPAVVTVIAGLCVLVCVEGIKNIWGRVRMREIIAASDASLFTSWYIPNFFSGSKSFPSAHAANATLMFLVPIWFGKSVKPETRKLTNLIVITWTALLSFSRICAAAHYLSDVAFGFAVSFVIVQIATAKYEKEFAGKPVPNFIKTTEIKQTEKAETPPMPRMAQDTARREIASSQAMKAEAPVITKAPDNTEKFRQAERFEPDAPADKIETPAPSDTPAPTRRPSIPARETVPLVPRRATNFSLDMARAEKAQAEALIAAENEAEAKRIDDKLRMAVTAEIKTTDISRPVMPDKPKAKSTAKKKTSTSGKKKTAKKKSAPKHDNAVQMHFRYDDEKGSITNELSDD
ncbi:MAG: phosphatase PAP2 family protein [Clostridiales bacterium]|nr:phosphatase PAP2 family protein [Clostridiales bacterium]